MAQYKDERRKTVTVSLQPRVMRLFEQYLRDTFYRSRSEAIETVILEHLLSYGYIDEYEYQKLREGKTYGKDL